MNLSNVRPLLTGTTNYFESQIRVFLTTQQKKIMAIAVAILCVSLGCVFYRCHFRGKVNLLSDSQHSLSSKKAKQKEEQLKALQDSASNLMQQKNWIEAIKLHEAALKIEPTNNWTLRNLARCLEQQNQWKEAAEKYEEILKNPPDFLRSEMLIKYAASLCAQAKYLEAVTQYEKALVLNPKDYHALIGCARALVKQGQGAEALKKYAQALPESIDVGIHNIEAIEDYALVLFQQGQYGESAKKYQAIVHSNLHLSALLGFADNLNQLGEFDRAEEYYKKAIQHFPDDAQAAEKYKNFQKERSKPVLIAS